MIDLRGMPANVVECRVFQLKPVFPVDDVERRHGAFYEMCTIVLPFEMDVNDVHRPRRVLLKTHQVVGRRWTPADLRQVILQLEVIDWLGELPQIEEIYDVVKVTRDVSAVGGNVDSVHCSSVCHCRSWTLPKIKHFNVFLTHARNESFLVPAQTVSSFRQPDEVNDGRFRWNSFAYVPNCDTMIEFILLKSHRKNIRFL